jgi:hypothetical protein
LRACFQHAIDVSGCGRACCLAANREWCERSEGNCQRQQRFW